MGKLQQLIDIANKEYDGHFTLLKFTTDWACCFGTVDDIRKINGYMAHGNTMDSAIEKCIQENCNFYDISRKQDAIQKRINFLNINKKWSDLMISDVNNNYSELLYKFIKNHPVYRFAHVILSSKKQGIINVDEVVFTDFSGSKTMNKDDILCCYPLKNITNEKKKYKQKLFNIKETCIVKDISVEFWQDYFLYGQDYFKKQFKITYIEKEN